MVLIRTLVASLLALSVFSTVPSSANTGDFTEFADGAMSVYQKFTSPSVQESEQFFAFIKSKWQKDDCSNQCSADGKKAAKEYATLYRVNLES